MLHNTFIFATSPPETGYLYLKQKLHGENFSAPFFGWIENVFQEAGICTFLMCVLTNLITISRLLLVHF